MFFVTVVWQWARALISGMLGALATAPLTPLLATPKVRLFTGNGIPGPDSDVADFPAATFTGYADQTFTPAGPVELTPNGMAVIGNVIFVADSPFTTAGDPVTGYLLYDGTTGYYGGERFPDPITVEEAGQFISVSLALPLPLQQSADFGV